MKWFLVFLMGSVLLTGCSSNSDSQTTPNSSGGDVQEAQSEEKSNSTESTESEIVSYSSKEEIAAALNEAKINNFHYIDEKKYEGDELQIVQTLNRMMKGVLEFDAEAVQSSYVKENAAHTENFSQVYAVAISMDDPRFNVLQDGNIEVFVKQKNVYFSDSPLKADETDKLYLMQKEDSDWRILSVTN